MRKALLAAAGAGLLVSLVAPTTAYAGCWTLGGPRPTPQVCLLPDAVTDLLK